MQQGAVRRWMTRLGTASALLVIGGCSGSGGGFSGLFDSIFGGDSGSAVFAGLDTGDGGFPGGGTGGGSVPSIATVHTPEPGSVVLFGSGLAGMALLRRRKTRKTQKRTTRS